VLLEGKNRTNFKNIGRGEIRTNTGSLSRKGNKRKGGTYNAWIWSKGKKVGAFGKWKAVEGQVYDPLTTRCFGRKNNDRKTDVIGNVALLTKDGSAEEEKLSTK